MSIRLAFSVITIALPSCSAVIYSLDENQGSLVGSGHTKKEIQQRLGKPIESEKLDPPISARILKEMHESINLLFIAHKTDGGARFYPDAASREVYEYYGKVQRNEDFDAYDSLTMAQGTFGLSELFLFPASIKKHADREKKIHTITVWYDLGNIAIASNWITKSAPSDKDRTE